MAIGDPYADIGPLVDRFGPDDGLMFVRLVDAASRAVERFTRRQFNKTTSATARRFRPLDWQRLPVDDFHTVTGLVVTVNGTAWDLATVDPRPWDGVKDGQPGWPFFDLFAVDRSWPPTATISVTAQWGWPAVPEAIKQATLDVAAAMWSANGASYPVSSETVAGYSVSYAIPQSGEYPAELAKALPYQRRRFGVA